MIKVSGWNPELNVGAALVDNQHKIIFDLIKDLGAASVAMADRKVIDTLLDVIENYVFRHFEAEEELIRHHSTWQAHCLEHYGLIKEFRKIRLSYRNNSTTEGNISVFLENWFLVHIKEHDVPLFDSIANGGIQRTQVRDIDEYPYQTTERRRHKRITRKKITDSEIIAECYNTNKLRNFRAVLLDISLGGIRLQSSDSFAMGDLVVITCKVGKNFRMNEKVRIVNASDESYGAEFINLAPATEKFLLELYGSINIKNL